MQAPAGTEDSIVWKNLDIDVAESESDHQHLSLSHTHSLILYLGDKVSPKTGQRLEFFSLLSAPGSLCDWESSPGVHVMPHQDLAGAFTWSLPPTKTNLLCLYLIIF